MSEKAGLVRPESSCAHLCDAVFDGIHGAQHSVIHATVCSARASGEYTPHAHLLQWL